MSMYESEEGISLSNNSYQDTTRYDSQNNPSNNYINNSYSDTSISNSKCEDAKILSKNSNLIISFFNQELTEEKYVKIIEE